MSSELYKKYRPSSLKGIIGNEATVRTLANMLERKTLPHTLLLQGPSGCGKTTLARILQAQLSCSEMDFAELNCSDFRGVDTIREIARQMHLAPTGGVARIWLLDEVHQMTKDAQNAALKILEDTPNHVYFFLCTTDPQKLIPTIKNRCCQLSVELLKREQLKKLIGRVLKREGEELSEELVEDITEASAGSARKALVILDRVLNLPESDREDAIKNDPEEKEVIELCRALIKGEQWSRVASLLKAIKTEPENVRYAVLGYARACLLGGKNARAALVIDAFADNFYDSKEAGLALACYEIIEGI